METIFFCCILVFLFWLAVGGPLPLIDKYYRWKNKKKWQCYEIHTVQARMYGCSKQCEECKKEENYKKC